MTTSNFTDVSTPEFPGYVRCGACSEVVLQSDTEAHVCSTPEDQRKKQEAEGIDALQAVIDDEAQSVWTRAEALHKLERVQEIMWENDLQRVEKRFTPEVVYQLVMDQRHESLLRTRTMRQSEFEMNDERRKTGIPFVSRKKLMNFSKITWCDKQEEQLTQSFRVKPLREWFEEVDYWAAKELGMRYIIKIKLEEIVI